MSENRQSRHIPRSQLVSMIADLRGVLYEVRGYFLARELGRKHWSRQEMQDEIKEALIRTAFDLSESDEVDGGYDPYHKELHQQQED